MIGRIVSWVIANLGYLSLLAIGLIVVGGIFKMPALLMVGAGFFMALLYVLFFGLVFSFLYEMIPEFRGKMILVFFLFIVIGGFLLAYFLTGGSSGEGSGFMYRGVRE